MKISGIERKRGVWEGRREVRVEQTVAADSIAATAINY